MTEDIRPQSNVSDKRCSMTMLHDRERTDLFCGQSPVPTVMPDEWKETEKRWLPLAEAIAFLFQISSKRTAPERRYKMPGRFKMSFRT
jgi:hypothetical protein